MPRKIAQGLVLLCALLALSGCGGESVQEEVFYNPETGVTLRLGMTRDEVEALLGQGTTAQDSSVVHYGSGEDFLLVVYDQEGLVQSLDASVENVSPAAFHWASAQGITYGSSLEELQARYPQGRDLGRVTSFAGDDDRQVEIDLFAAQVGEAAFLFVLTEGDGVVSMSLAPRIDQEQWAKEARGDFLYNSARPAVLSLGMPMERVEALLGEGREPEEADLPPIADKVMHSPSLYGGVALRAYDAGDSSLLAAYREDALVALALWSDEVFRPAFSWSAQGAVSGSGLDSLTACLPSGTYGTVSSYPINDTERAAVLDFQVVEEDYVLNAYLTEEGGVFELSLLRPAYALLISGAGKGD